MNEQTIQMILQLAEQGGSMALWMFMVAQLRPIIIYGMFFGSALWGVALICKAFYHGFEVTDRNNKRD